MALNYKVLEDREVDIFGKKAKVNSIVEKKDSDGTVEYIINGGQTFSRFDVAVAVSIVENQIKVENQPKDLISRLKRKFGLFVRFDRLNLDPQVIPPEVRDVAYQGTLGVRSYGFKKCGVFGHIRLFSYILDVEFSWREKDIYEKGELPNPFIDHKQIF